ncbi:MAG: glycosyltransferase [Bacteroidales bacterium]|nr:glycosyltransferase [Bacteroidales bacterium]
MKVLHIIRSKSESAIAPFITKQVQSLQELGVEAEIFQVQGKGVLSYLKNSLPLRRFIRSGQFDLIHAHYSLCGLTAILAFSGKPIVLSLMGSDALGEFTGPHKISLRSLPVVWLTRIIQPFVSAIIVKSENIRQKVYRKSITEIIPNGVNLERFKPENKMDARKALGLQPNKKYILFLANPTHQWKNFGLAEQAVQLLNDAETELLTPYPVGSELVAKYMNAADVLVHTSFMEGSSNVIKEAMACNCPIVATHVGDAAWVIGETEGCYITGFNPSEVSEKLKLALSFASNSNSTNGHNQILNLKLDTTSSAKKILNLYNQLV